MNYQGSKAELKEIAKSAKIEFKHDKPAINQTINDNTFFISQNYNLSEHETELLHNYACTLQV